MPSEFNIFPPRNLFISETKIKFSSTNSHKTRKEPGALTLLVASTKTKLSIFFPVPQSQRGDDPFKDFKHELFVDFL